MKNDKKTKNELIAKLESVHRKIKRLESQLKKRKHTKQDITELKQVEEALRESEEKHKTLIETTDTGYLILDAQGRVIDANKEYIRLTGYDTLDEILGRSVVEWTAPHDLARNAIEVKKCAEQGYIRNLEIDYINRSEQITPIEINATVVGSGESVRILSLCRDITERKQAEEALHLEKENFRRSLDESPIGVRIVTADGDTLYANRAILDFYGYDSLEELQKTPLRARYTSESYAEFQKRKQQRQSGDFSTSKYEISIVRKNGEVLHLQVHRKEVLWNNAQQFLVMYQDITERKQAQEQITMLAHAVRSINECVSITDTNNNIVFVNRAFLDTYGYTEQELLGKNINLVRSLKISDEDGERIRLSTLEGMWHGELMNKRKDGSEFPIFLSTTMVCDNKWEPIALIGVATDVTERKREEEEINKSHKELRMLANHLQNIREEERNHLAREFHDQIGQSMTALKMDLSLLLRTISDEKQDVQRKLVIEELQSMQKLVDETSQLLWAIISELRPQMLDDLGLVATFEWEAQRFESRTGISCEFKSTAGDIQMDSKKSIALFRIYQEALTNITRHANATVVKSVLQRDDEVLVLEIKDNGRGIAFDKQSKPKSFGIIGMRERALAISGSFKISGVAGEGTTIIVQVPLGQVATEESTGH